MLQLPVDCAHAPSLIAGAVLSVLALTCFWIEWRGRPQRESVEHFEQLGGINGLS